MNVANQHALDKAFELASRQPQPWGPEEIVTAAQVFEQYLTGPRQQSEMQFHLGLLADRVEALETRLDELENAPAGKQTRPRRAQAPTTTETAPPDLDAPVDF